MRIIFIFIFVYSLNFCYGQDSYERLTSKLHEFSKKYKLYTQDSNISCTSYFFIKELVKNDSTVSLQYGIYQFEPITEDTHTNIFFKRKDTIEIYDISNFGFFMPELLNFLDEPQFALSDEMKLNYIKAIINIYKESSELMTNIIIEENHNNYKFLIDSKNYRK